MTFKPSVKTDRERAQNEIDDAIEAVSVLDNAIACGFLKDKHSFVCKIKSYKIVFANTSNFSSYRL